MMYLWKEWKEQSRAKGMWLCLSMVVLSSIFILIESISLPVAQGFRVFLLSLYDMNLFILPLLSLYICSFSIMQEKEQKTLLILLSKRESYRKFIYRKTLAIQGVTVSLFIGWYFILMILVKFFFPFDASAFLVFLVTSLVLLLIFNQLGVLLGSICKTRMQLIGANIFTWFTIVFILDLVYLYLLPSVNGSNVKTFSTFYFLDPIHTLHFYLETGLELFPLDHLSRLMAKMIWLKPIQFLSVDLIVWLLISLELGIWFHSKGERS
ncbi:MAG TPA: ABC transporter permease subunit [Bacillota bacterium]|nr:ABC transporter permease subunit [Bacillota bacterium]